MLKQALGILIGAALMAATSAAHADPKVVNVYNWSGYFSSDVLKQFTKATGIAVNYETYDSKEAAQFKLSAGNSGYDVVVLAAEPFLDTDIGSGLFAPLDKAKLPSLAELDPAVLKLMAIADPGNTHAAAYLWGFIGLAYDGDEVKKRLPDVPRNSYNLLFDPRYAKKLAGCGIGLIDDSAVILPMALQYLGIDPNKATLEDYQKAADAIMKIRPYVKYIDSTTLVSDLAAKKLCLATEWNGDAVQAAIQMKQADPKANPGFIVPREGGLAFIDAMVVPKDAPHADAAHAFIDFLLQPKWIAQSTNELRYANAVPAAKALVAPELTADARIYPTDAVMARLTLVKVLPVELQDAAIRHWTRIKSGN